MYFRNSEISFRNSEISFHNSEMYIGNSEMYNEVIPLSQMFHLNSTFHFSSSTS